MSFRFFSRLTRVLLYALFCLIVAAIVVLPFVLEKLFTFFGDDYANAPGYGWFIVFFLILAGIGALYILFSLIRILKTLDGDPFVEKNASALKSMGIVSEGLCVLFAIKSVWFFTPMTVACAVVTLLCGLFALVLSDVFARAVTYKIENDLTI
ncbi:hypothetical protein SDC9_161242 [bioreactor metagenome]|uniref:DUF2975 domain-containing protein n=1 Tax=bioreactor metagenome TaxID=1076179 RepID=A0A645FJT1_9ZZZZ